MSGVSTWNLEQILISYRGKGNLGLYYDILSMIIMLSTY